MKAKTDCSKCRIGIYRQAKNEYLKEQYKWFTECADSFAALTTVCAIAVMYRRGRSPEYIEKFFDDICFMYDYPEFNDKRIDMPDLMKQFEEEHGLDFSKIHLHLESEKEFIRNASKGE